MISLKKVRLSTPKTVVTAVRLAIIALLGAGSQTQAMSLMRPLASATRLGAATCSTPLMRAALPASLYGSMYTARAFHTTPSTHAQDHYTTLGVSENATQAEIKKAFHARAKEEHPDRSTRTDAKERFQNLQNAYATLSNAIRRQAYDFSRQHSSTGSSGRQHTYTYTRTNTGPDTNYSGQYQYQQARNQSQYSYKDFKNFQDFQDYYHATHGAKSNKQKWETWRVDNKDAQKNFTTARRLINASLFVLGAFSLGKIIHQSPEEKRKEKLEHILYTAGAFAIPTGILGLACASILVITKQTAGRTIASLGREIVLSSAQQALTGAALCACKEGASKKEVAWDTKKERRQNSKKLGFYWGCIAGLPVFFLGPKNIFLKSGAYGTSVALSTLAPVIGSRILETVYTPTPKKKKPEPTFWQKLWPFSHQP